MMRRLPRESRMRKETKRPKAVVQRYDDQAMAGEGFAIATFIERLARSDAPKEISTARNPHHHRLARAAWPLRHPDIQVKTVLFGNRAVWYEGKCLGTDRAERRGVAHARPRFHWNRF